MPITVVSQEELTVGVEQLIDGTAPDGRFAVVFEDDGETGYFYALVRSGPNQQHEIEDAMHIYDVASVSDRDIPSVFVIGWSRDNRKAVLLINDYPHAVFDFSARRGYCRSAFPPPSVKSGWEGHAWDDSVSELFA